MKNFKSSKVKIKYFENLKQSCHALFKANLITARQHDLIMKKIKKRLGLEELFVVRLWDRNDGWMNVSDPVSSTEATRIWNERTKGGKQYTKYTDGSYYYIFPADTVMIFNT